MRTRTLRGELGLGVLAATAGAILLSILTVHPALHRIALRGVRRDLERASRACAGLAALEERRLSDEVEVLARSPALESSMSRPSPDRGEVLEAARGLRRGSSFGVVFVADARSRLLADVGSPGRFGDDLGGLPGVHEAIRGATRVGIWNTGGREILVGVAPILSGDEVLGLLAVGDPVDDAKAASIRRLAGTDVLFLRGTQVLVGSWGRPTRSRPSAAELDRLRAASDPDDEVVAGRLAGEDRLSVFVPLPGGVDLVLSEDLDRAMEPFLSAELLILAAGAVTASLAVLLGHRILGRIEQPIRGLTLAAGRLAGGDLGVVVPETGPIELRQLAAGFNAIVAKLGHRAPADTPAPEPVRECDRAPADTPASGLVREEFPSPPSIQPARAPRVLLVDDNPVDRRVALRMLVVLGCEAECAVDGSQAVEACSRAEYDAVLMDCRMPGMDGYEATRSIRNREKFGRRHVRILAVTANLGEGEREKCLAAGMDDHVPKPITLEILRSILVASAEAGPKASSDPHANLASR